ncbi:MAG: glycosyltransferase family 39 protein [Chloracidobacterium sp.]|nr:glycosyltransferase family 39 protein [Chloracidobacterium validum]
MPSSDRLERCPEWLVWMAVAIIFLSACFPPPYLMDDVDATQAQIARTMLETGDWVTPRLNGIVYLEKAPLKYWLIALSFAVFGVHDWAARLPIGLGILALGWLTLRMGTWAFGARAGFYAGLVLATSIGLFLFTRILIVDVLLALSVALALWAYLRALDPQEAHPRRWSALMAVSLAAGFLFKGFIGLVFPLAAMGLYALATGQWRQRNFWQRWRPVTTTCLVLSLTLPWFVAATLRNPPYVDFTLTSEPGQYRGFFWFFVFNEHVLRFLGRRYPRDYNTVPRLWFWLSHLVWFFPWSLFLPGVARLRLTRRPATRAEQMTLLAVVWIGFVMVFFSFSTTQEYYSLPIYPAVAVLLGAALTQEGRFQAVGRWLASGVAALAALAAGALLVVNWNTPTPGDIAQALAKSPDVYAVYTLSLGHMGDLTVRSFAYLRVPLALATVAFLVGAVGVHLARGRRAWLAIAGMLTLLLVAARLAMVAFDPYLGSYPLAKALVTAQRTHPGRVVVDNQYYAFSSVFFYANVKGALLLNGRTTNLEYGSHAPGAPDVFLDDDTFAKVWRGPERTYLLVEDVHLPRIEKLVGVETLHQIATSGGKFLLCNQPKVQEEPHLSTQRNLRKVLP